MWDFCVCSFLTFNVTLRLTLNDFCRLDNLQGQKERKRKFGVARLSDLNE